MPFSVDNTRYPFHLSFSTGPPEGAVRHWFCLRFPRIAYPCLESAVSSTHFAFSATCTYLNVHIAYFNIFDKRCSSTPLEVTMVPCTYHAIYCFVMSNYIARSKPYMKHALIRYFRADRCYCMLFMDSQGNPWWPFEATASHLKF